MFDIESSLTSKINSLGKALAATSTAALHKHATDTYGWPSDISSQVSIVYHNGKFVENHPDSIDSDLKDLEYGAPDSVLAPAIRTFMGGY